MIGVVQLISYPMRLALDGTVANVEQGSDAEIEEQLTIAILTKPGERVTVPDFGCDDPAFEGFEASNLQRHCDDFGPELSIEAVQVDLLPDNRQAVRVEWEYAEADGEEDEDDQPERATLS